MRFYTDMQVTSFTAKDWSFKNIPIQNVDYTTELFISQFCITKI